MLVHVQLFALAREKIGTPSVAVELSDPATVGALRRALAFKFPDLAPLTGKLMFSVNAEYATDRTLLTPECDIAAIPPVSGG